MTQMLTQFTVIHIVAYTAHHPITLCGHVLRTMAFCAVLLFRSIWLAL